MYGVIMKDGNGNHVVDPIIVTFPIHTNTTLVHQYFMQRSLHQAQRASHLYSEVPIGAVVVRNITTAAAIAQPQDEQIYKILSEEHNRVEMNYDASAHAEMLALRDAARNIQNWRLNCNTENATMNRSDNKCNSQTILYCTLEPCVMCFAAALAFRIDQIVYGAPDLRLGACGSYVNMLDITISVTTKHPYHTISDVTSGIYANESSILLRNFFRERRQQQQQQQQQQHNEPLRRLPLPTRQQQRDPFSELPISVHSITKPLPFYRRWWRHFVSRFR